MKAKSIKKRAEKIAAFFKEYKRMPSYSEIASLFNFSSKNSAFRLVGRLIEEGYIQKDNKGRLTPLPGRLGLPLFGYVQAGFPSPAEEELVDTLSIDEYMIGKPESSFMLKVIGDSMIDAGIHADDLAIIERGTEPKNGDIVLAEVDNEWTIKYFQKRGRKVRLIPANNKYPIITPREELKIGGIVKGIIRKY